MVAAAGVAAAWAAGGGVVGAGVAVWVEGDEAIGVGVPVWAQIVEAQIVDIALKKSRAFTADFAIMLGTPP